MGGGGGGQGGTQPSGFSNFFPFRPSGNLGEKVYGQDTNLSNIGQFKNSSHYYLMKHRQSANHFTWSPRQEDPTVCSPHSPLPFPHGHSNNRDKTISGKLFPSPLQLCKRAFLLLDAHWHIFLSAPHSRHLSQYSLFLLFEGLKRSPQAIFFLANMK